MISSPNKKTATPCGIAVQILPKPGPRFIYLSLGLEIAG
jgi:hypothetical protein